jgi:predicted TIM-barrel fold metal-dependent hydrolase
MERLVLVSADGHAGPLPEDYRPYLDRIALEHFDGFVEDHRRWVESLYGICHYSDETIATIDDRNAIRTGGTTGAWDVTRRLKEMDDEGIAAELLVYNHQLAGQPFFSPVCSKWSPELRAAGVRAFHRWLTDYKSAAEDRFIPLAESGPCTDMEETVKEIRWAAEHGFKLVELPGLCVDPDLPPLYSDYFEPLWQVCAELGLGIAMHAGWGQPQGKIVEIYEELIRETGGFDEFVEEQAVQTQALTAPTLDMAAPFAITVSVARAMWQLMLSGVFDRHPGLRFTLIEVRAGWMPTTLKWLDARFDQGGTGMARKPSEYFEQNISLAPSFVHRSEIEMRHEIGVEKMMFARDYPHLEGTWPNTHDWIRAAFAGVPLSEARLMIGENAIEWFGLDRKKLEKIAAQIGPAPETLIGDHHVRGELINHFHARGGYLKPPLRFNEAEFKQLLGNDISAANPATR